MEQNNKFFSRARVTRGEGLRMAGWAVRGLSPQHSREIEGVLRGSGAAKSSERTALRATALWPSLCRTTRKAA